MKDKLEAVVGSIATGLLFVWNLPVLLLIGGGFFIHWLLFDLPRRGKQRQDFTNEIVYWRQHKRKYAYLDYNRNHPFSEWLEGSFVPKYGNKLIAPKYSSVRGMTISEELCAAIYNSAEHGSDDLYEDVAYENDEIATLFVFNPDGSVTRWTPPMIDDNKVNTRRAKALYDKVTREAIEGIYREPESDSVATTSFWRQAVRDVEEYNFEKSPDAGPWRRVVYFINSKPWLSWPLVALEFLAGVWIMYYWWLEPSVQHFWWDILLGLAGLILVAESVAGIFMRVRRARGVKS